MDEFKKIGLKVLLIKLTFFIKIFTSQNSVGINNTISNSSNKATFPNGYFSILKVQQEKEIQDKEKQGKEKNDITKEIKNNISEKREDKKEENNFVNNQVSQHTMISLSKIFNDPALNIKKISIEASPSRIQDIIQLIGKGTNIDFVIDADVKGNTGKLSFKEVTPGFILNYILTHNDPPLALIKDMNVWRIMGRSGAEQYIKLFEKEQIISKMLNVNYSTINEKFKDLLEKGWSNIVNDQKSVSSMFIDEERKKIFLRSYPKLIEEFECFLNDIDKVVTQVKIDAIILFAHKDFGFDFGINWSGIYNRENTIKRKCKKFDFVGLGGRLDDFPEPTKPIDPRHGNLFVNPMDFALNLFTRSCQSRDGRHGKKNDTFITLPFVFGGANLNLSRLNLLLNAAESEEKVKIMSRPSVMTSDNEVAKILIGESIPIQATAVDVLAVAVQNITSINFKDVGIALEVHPSVSPDKKNIKLEIFIEESKIISGTTITNEKGIMQNPPVIDIIKVHNKVNLKNGQTVVIGGLSRISEIKGNNKVPFLSRIPIIGKLFFTATRECKEEFEQFIFITPTIVD